jgi:hypothetical protein
MVPLLSMLAWETRPCSNDYGISACPRVQNIRSIDGMLESTFPSTANSFFQNTGLPRRIRRTPESNNQLENNALLLVHGLWRRTNQKATICLLYELYVASQCLQLMELSQKSKSMRRHGNGKCGRRVRHDSCLWPFLYNETQWPPTPWSFGLFPPLPNKMKQALWNHCRFRDVVKWEQMEAHVEPALDRVKIETQSQ